MSQFAVIIAAAGSGTRFHCGTQKKTYAMLHGKPVWQHSVAAFARREDVGQIVIVVSPGDVDWFRQTYSRMLDTVSADVVAGGAERFDSVPNALPAIRAECTHVAIHDAARPCVSDALIEEAFAVARQHGNAVPVVPVSSTLKRSSDGIRVEQTVSREALYESQTPQVFELSMLKKAFQSAKDIQPTDEAQLLELLGIPVYLSGGCPLNRKITMQEDLKFADAALGVLQDNTQVRFDGPIGDGRLLR